MSFKKPDLFFRRIIFYRICASFLVCAVLQGCACLIKQVITAHHRRNTKEADYSNDTIPVRDSGHTTVIYGYVYWDGIVYFLIRDSAKNESALALPYGYIVNGRTAQNHLAADNYIWDGILVCVTEYSDDTIPYYFMQNNT